MTVVSGLKVQVRWRETAARHPWSCSGRCNSYYLYKLCLGRPASSSCLAHGYPMADSCTSTGTRVAGGHIQRVPSWSTGTLPELGRRLDILAKKATSMPLATGPVGAASTLGE